VFQIIYVMAYLGMFSVGSQAFGMKDQARQILVDCLQTCDSFAMVQFRVSSSRPQIHSFYGLVTMNKLDDKIFSDSERLKSFGDINTRYNGYTPLHILIDRPDATIDQVKVLFKCGAKTDIPVVVKKEKPGAIEVCPTHHVGFNFLGDTPPGQQGNPKPYCGNPDVVRYVFQKMLKKKIKEAIEAAKLKNKLEQESEGFFIARLPRVRDNWPEMKHDEAREHLRRSVKDYKEFELFVSNLTPEALDVFLKMQKMTS
jgi:hypothetical protein